MKNFQEYMQTRLIAEALYENDFDLEPILGQAESGELGEEELLEFMGAVGNAIGNVVGGAAGGLVSGATGLAKGLASGYRYMNPSQQQNQVATPQNQVATPQNQQKTQQQRQQAVTTLQKQVQQLQKFLPQFDQQIKALAQMG